MADPESTIANAEATASQTVTAAAPTNRVSGFQYARAGSYLSQGLDRLSQGLDAVAEPLAREQAATDLQNQNLVTRDAQGNITVGKPAGLPILGPAGEAYQHAIAAGTLAQGDNMAANDIAGIRAATEGNPAEFKKQADAYSQNLMTRNPGIVGMAMVQHADSIASQHYDGMVQQQATIGVSNAKQAMVDAHTGKFNTMASLALQGGTDTPEFKKAAADYASIGQALVSNPAFGISADVMAQNDKADQQLMHGYAIAGHVDSDMRGPGGVEGARKNLNDALDQDNDLSPKDKAMLRATGEARIRFNIDGNQSAIDANKADILAFGQDVKNPSASARLSEPIWQAAFSKSMSVFNTEGVAQLHAMHDVWQFQQATRGLSPGQQLQQQGVGQPPPAPFVSSLGAATKDLNLTPQEQFLYQRHLDVLQATNGGVPNPDGKGNSTLYQTSVEHDGKTYNIPTVWDGKFLSAKDAVERAGAVGWDKWPSYSSDDAAEARYSQMHGYMEKDMPAYQAWKSRGMSPGYSYNAAVIQHESNGVATAGDPSHAYGLAQFMPGTWRGVMENHPELGLTEGGRTDAGQVDKALTAVRADSAAKLTAAGIAPTDKNVFMTHFLGDAGALSFFQAAKTNPGQSFADAFPKEAAANPTIASQADGTPRTLAQVYGLMTAKFAGTPTVTPASANGTPFSDAQLSANPWLQSSYVRAIATDPENRESTARSMIASAQRSIESGIVPGPQTMAMISQLAQSNPKLAEEASHLQATFEGDGVARKALAMTPDQGQGYLAAYKQAAQGADLYHAEVAMHAQESYQKYQEALKKDPYGTAVSQGWDHGKGAPAPLQFDDPQALAIALHQRSDLLNSIGNHTGQTGGSVIEPAALAQVKSGIAGGSAAQIQNIGQAVGSLPDGQRQATLAAVGPSIAAAAKSGDPAKMAAAYGFMGQQYDANPMTFEKTFGKDADISLSIWRRETQFLPPDQVAKRMETALDPSQSEARKRIDDAVKKETSTLTPDAVASKFTTFSLWPSGWGGQTAQTPTMAQTINSAEAMRSTYVDAYRLARQQTDDVNTANSVALERMQKTWGVSSANGNQVMKNPPERYYPQVGGSQNYIGEQLDKDVYEATGAASARPAITASYGTPQSAADRAAIMQRQAPIGSPDSPEAISRMGMYNAPRALGSDKTTDAEIAAGKPPSYYVVTQDSKGLWNPLTSDGVHLFRFRPDPQAVPSVAATHAPGFVTGTQVRAEPRMNSDVVQ